MHVPTFNNCSLVLIDKQVAALCGRCCCRLATALQAQGRPLMAEAAARSAEQHATCHADRAAATQLVASITKQGSQLHTGQQHTLRGAHLPVSVGQARAGYDLQDKVDPVGTAASNRPPTGSQQMPDSSHCAGSSSSNRSSYIGSTNSNTQLHEQPQQQQQRHATRVGAPDAVGQLLQQFAAVIKQQSSQASAETAQPATASPAAGTKGNSRSAGVLLPLLIQQQQQPDHGPLSDQLVLPGHAVRPGKQSAARKPLIEELPDP